MYAEGRSNVKNITLSYTYFFSSLVILEIVFVLFLQSHVAAGDQSYSEASIKVISAETMSGMQGMSNNMSGMQGMSNNMSGMQGMSNNMSGMQGMSGMSGMSVISNDKTSLFLEWMLILVVVLVGVPFAWVLLRERRKKSNLP